MIQIGDIVRGPSMSGDGDKIRKWLILVISPDGEIAVGQNTAAKRAFPCLSGCHPQTHMLVSFHRSKGDGNERPLPKAADRRNHPAEH